MSKPFQRFLLASVLAALAGCAAQPPTRHVFFAGGTYAGAPGKEVMHGAMYVEHLKPAKVTQRWPLVLISGTAQTAVNWMSTPDGREGWAQYFVDRGFEVYMVDQPLRGRSAWQPGIDAELGRPFPVSTVENLFTSSTGDWPQAKLHTQWPGTGRKGDPVFDQFYASQVGYVASNSVTQEANQVAGAALLDRIGPAVLITHSQAGPFGWLIANARPSLVKAIVAIEPQGPPIQSGARKTASWGVADIPLTYQPAASTSAELQVELQGAPDGPGLQACWVQKAPARQLVKLKGIPISVIGTEASYHAPFDHCTVRWLRDSGIGVDYIRLADIGIRGNGHMVMLEKNSDQVAAVIGDWVANAAARSPKSP
ncbi:MAG: alpha/beta hydrolase [Pseudomonadota bacterium]